MPKTKKPSRSTPETRARDRAVAALEAEVAALVRVVEVDLPRKRVELALAKAVRDGSVLDLLARVAGDPSRAPEIPRAVRAARPQQSRLPAPAPKQIPAPAAAKPKRKSPEPPEERTCSQCPKKYTTRPSDKRTTCGDAACVAAAKSAGGKVGGKARWGKAPRGGQSRLPKPRRAKPDADPGEEDEDPADEPGALDPDDLPKLDDAAAPEEPEEPAAPDPDRAPALVFDALVFDEDGGPGDEPDADKIERARRLEREQAIARRALTISAGRKAGGCMTCGRRATARCEHPLAGPKAGQACGRPMCARHACVHGGATVCLPHRNLRAEAAAN